MMITIPVLGSKLESESEYIGHLRKGKQIVFKTMTEIRFQMCKCKFQRSQKILQILGSSKATF